MTEEEAVMIVEMMEENIPFFPKKAAGQSLIVAELADFCATSDQGIWLARRMVRLYPKRWPGVGEARAVYCSKFRPADGIEAYSKIYPDGIPGEQKPVERAQIKGPRAAVECVDPAATKLLEELGSVLNDMPPAPKVRELGARAVQVDRELKRMMGELPDSQPRPPQVLTQADIDAALVEYRAGKVLTPTEGV